MHCPSCQRKNEDFHNYCYHCGHKLTEDEGKSLTSKSEWDYKEDSLYPDDTAAEFDITKEVPLRRYRKDKPVSKPAKIAKAVGIIAALALAALAIFLVGRGFNLGNRGQTKVSQTIAVSSSVEETTKDGEKAYKVIFNTVNGREINFLDDTKEVNNGRGEFIVKDTLLYSHSPEQNEEGLYEVNIDAIISAPNLPDSTERVNIILSPPYEYAPFTLNNPSSVGIPLAGSAPKLAFKIQPDSQVFINEDDVSDLLSKEGIFEKDFPLPDGQDKLKLDIRISTPGYLDNLQQIVFRDTDMEVPIIIEDRVPILGDEEWIKVRGNIPPGATLEADQEIFEEPDIDQETGDFTLYIKASQPGYTPCILTAKMDGKQSSVEIILERQTTVDAYTSTAWEPKYEELQGDDQLHNGRHFSFEGEITDILETGQRSIFTLTPHGSSESDQSLHIEFWGNFAYSSGDRVRIFANRWGNRKDMPRFLAKYIYDSE